MGKNQKVEKEIETCVNLGPGVMHAEGEVVCSINLTLFRTLKFGLMAHRMYEKRKYAKRKTGLNLRSYISRLKTVPKPLCPNSEHGQDLRNFTIYNLEGTFGMEKRSDCSRIPPPF